MATPRTVELILLNIFVGGGVCVHVCIDVLFAFYAKYIFFNVRSP